ncbi:hypothetical protein BDN71DRAFT_558957 [Pleurotus eryngii]|uniref:Uncharacterized protein n=1 Tax=Pleurotus eryngii TaxID=5323 RepID=A0A9P6DIE7_PLEER|nr:hypothetical protein BDN71DRAFT_558957 [Pleurotus eryngii]
MFDAYIYVRCSSFNPGRIDPTDAAWIDSRKPLAAAWQTTSGHRFFTVNLHLSSKSGSASTQGDARPPVNLGVDQRTSQIERVSVSIFAFYPKVCCLLNVIARLSFKRFWWKTPMPTRWLRETSMNTFKRVPHLNRCKTFCLKLTK